MDDTTTSAPIPPGSILVGADGTDASNAAVLWAAEQAALERRPLVVVTVVETTRLTAMALSGPGAGYLPDTGDLERAGRATAEDTAALARQHRPGLDVLVHVTDGYARQLLVDLAGAAHLLVLGSRGRGYLGSKLLGSVSAAVSRQAACPVVVCRPLQRDAGHSGSGVVVAADGTAESVPVVEFAFNHASLRGVPLTVMHCMWDVVAALHGPVRPWEDGHDDQWLLLSETIAGLREKYPDVRVERELSRGLADECLNADPTDWDLIVVGRHPIDNVWRMVTGAVATSVVERAHGPVAVVPEAAPR